MRHPTRSLPCILACLCVVAPCAARAAAAPPTASPTFWGELLAILVPLAFIIVALLLALRHIRRRYGFTGQDAPLSVVQILPVGPRERVVLVRARSGRVLAIGVGAQSVGLIAELDAEDIAPPPGQPAAAPDPAARRTFLDLMRRPQGPGTR
ncbi:FliO/MopB family protein [Luteimonas huabeiensis]|uniref:FliO/MopB family protein n=1 Tax=Luteimonas huabeiensis TaxID=1244513 RepID=UPI00046361D8|nr:flagellar biosynthetic protein FliO [Luteimonas huabeiensis]